MLDLGLVSALHHSQHISQTAHAVHQIPEVLIGLVTALDLGSVTAVDLRLVSVLDLGYSDMSVPWISMMEHNV